MLDLSGVRNWDEIVAMVAAAVRDADPGAWIIGRGWHQEKWDVPPQPAVEGLPVHEGLSRVSPNNPVFLAHASGHASFANASALELAGISSEMADPPGGEIVRDAEGDPTGALRETAQSILKTVFWSWFSALASRSLYNARAFSSRFMASIRISL